MISNRFQGDFAGHTTPFYLYDMELLRKTVNSAVKSATERGYHLHYAIKANNEAPVVDVMRNAGLGVDCVSIGEMRYAIENGFSPLGVVFAGVGKRDDELEYAITQGIYAINCECVQELDVINDIAAGLGRIANVALRLNPNIDPHTHHHITTGLSSNKFGIDLSELDGIITSAHRLSNVNICGIHFHIGSQITDYEPFEMLCREVNSIAQWLVESGIKLTHINLGGGLGVDYDHPDMNPIPDFEGYFATFEHHLNVPNTEVHFELGRSLVAQCGELISRVLYTKTNGAGEEVVLIDASMTELVRPAMYGASHSIENLTSKRPSRRYTVGGTVCESSDIFARQLLLPKTQRGDIVSIKSAGAYGSSMASCYNMHSLPRSVYSDQKNSLKRNNVHREIYRHQPLRAHRP